MQQLRQRLAADPDAVRLHLPDLVDFMLGTGVRIGEACAVRWSAVDLDAGALRIDATLIRVPGRGLAIREFPKTTADRRTLALPAFVVDLLRTRAEARSPDFAAVVFPTSSGQLRDPNNTSGALRKAFDRAGFDWVTSHVFRNGQGQRSSFLRLAAGRRRSASR